MPVFFPRWDHEIALSGSESLFMAHAIEVSPHVDISTGSRLVKLVPDAATRITPGRTATDSLDRLAVEQALDLDNRRT